MEAYPDIRSQLDLYLRGELDTNRMSEIKALIDTAPAWYSTYHALLTESRGIRMTALQDLTSRLQALEKTIGSQGDLSPSPSSISTTNETEDLENNYTPPAKELDTSPDPLLIKGIRYTTLRDELRKLQDVEKGIKKNDSGGSGGGRVLRMRYWWAVAVGVVVMVVGGYILNNFKFNQIQSLIVLPEQLYITRSSDTEDNLKKEAYYAYSNKKYKRAHEIFFQLYKLNKLSNEDQLYFAFCKLLISDFEGAEEIFLKANKERLAQYDLNYYLAICKMAKNKYKEAKNLIDSSQINKNSEFYNLINKFLNNKNK